MDSSVSPAAQPGGLFGPVDLDGPVQRIEAELADYRRRGLRMFASSSFQTNSVVLLHLLSRFAPEVPVCFLNTGFHFPETLDFRRNLERRLGLRIVELFSPVERGQQRDAAGRLLFTSDPDHCCHLNKVLPLEPVLASHDLWINGVRAAQSETRAAMAREERGRRGILRYHPLLDWSSRMVWTYLQRHDLPSHPLEDQGYHSVGCRPCTRKVGEGLDDRSGRWTGLKKTECGLHLGGTGSGS
jgi:phosphoadenosine phosphosulfate reductase